MRYSSMGKFLEKIKVFFVGIGIAILICVFYVIRKEFVAKQLQKLLLDNYNKKSSEIDAEIDKMTDEVVINNNEIITYGKKIEELDDKQRKIHEKVNTLSNDDLVSAVNDWFKSR